MPNFNYTRDIPDGPDDPSEDQPDMKINTNSIANILAVEHFGFKNNNGGLHQQATFPQRSDPAAVANAGIVYTKSIPATGTELYYRRSSNSAVEPSQDIQLTGKFAQTTPGYTFLANNFLIQWGQVATGGALNGSVLFPTSFRSGLAPFNITFGETKLVNLTTAASVFVDFNTLPTDSQFNWARTTNNIGFYWFAVGLN